MGLHSKVDPDEAFVVGRNNQGMAELLEVGVAVSFGKFFCEIE